MLQFVGIGALAAVSAILQARLSPRSEGTVLTISVNEARRHNPLWIDARNRLEFDQEHVPHALNLPLIDAIKGQIPTRIGQTPGMILVYCDGPHCGASEKVGKILSQRLGRPIYVLAGGLQELRRNGRVGTN